MSSLQTLKHRIKTISNTSKVVSAMRMVASNKLKKTSNRLAEYRDTQSAISSIFKQLASSDNISSVTESYQKMFEINTNPRQYLFIVIGSDKGLCGSFNSHLFKSVSKDIKEIYSTLGVVQILTIGKKATNYFQFKNRDLIYKEYQNIHHCEFDTSIAIHDIIFNQTSINNIDECRIYYNEFISIMSHTPTYKTLFPVNICEDHSEGVISTEGSELFTKVTKDHIISSVLHPLLENKAGEEAARMIAMEGASNNASKIYDALRIQYNATRQTSITKEICEIISGAEAIQ